MASLPRKPLPFFPTPDDLDPAIRASLAAWGRGEMTPTQQTRVLGWIIGDLCQAQTIEPIDISESAAAHTRGQRRIGMVIAQMTGVRLRLPLTETETAIDD